MSLHLPRQLKQTWSLYIYPKHLRLRKETGNTYRLERVVEILLSSPGCKLAEFSPDGAASDHEDVVFHPFFLYRPRIELYRRIDARVEQMVEQGILQVRAGSTSNCVLYKSTRFSTRCQVLYNSLVPWMTGSGHALGVWPRT